MKFILTLAKPEMLWKNYRKNLIAEKTAHFSPSKYVIKKVKKQPTEWDSFTNYISNKGLVFRLYKESIIQQKDIQTNFYKMGKELE